MGPHRSGGAAHAECGVRRGARGRLGDRARVEPAASSALGVSSMAGGGGGEEEVGRWVGAGRQVAEPRAFADRDSTLEFARRGRIQPRELAGSGRLHWSAESGRAGRARR